VRPMLTMRRGNVAGAEGVAPLLEPCAPRGSAGAPGGARHPGSSLATR
jgi:hypothetical protein